MRLFLFFFSILLITSCTKYISTGLVIYEDPSNDKKLIQIAGTNISFWSDIDSINTKSIVQVKSETINFKNPQYYGEYKNHAADHGHFERALNHVRKHIRPIPGTNITIGGEIYYPAQTNTSMFTPSDQFIQNAWTKLYQGNQPDGHLYLNFLIEEGEDNSNRLIQGYPVILHITDIHN